MADRIPGVPDSDEVAAVRFAASPALQAEFGSLDIYTAWCRAARSGRISAGVVEHAVVAVPETDEAAREAYRGSADLQAEFGKFDGEKTWLAYCRGVRSARRVRRY